MSDGKRQNAGAGPDAKRQRVDPPSADDMRVLKEAETVQDQLDKINDEASDKVLAIEQEYNRVRRPVYVKRSEVLSNLPQFWKTALLNHPIFKRFISEEDAEILDHLTEIDLQEADDIKSGFKIIFKFSENSYFTNKELTKNISYDDEGRITVDATPINWAGSKREDEEFIEKATFVRWLSETDSEEATIAETLKDELWPNPVKFYTGDVEDADLDAFDEDEEDDEDEGETADEEDL